MMLAKVTATFVSDSEALVLTRRMPQALPVRVWHASILRCKRLFRAAAEFSYMLLRGPF